MSWLHFQSVVVAIGLQSYLIATLLNPEGFFMASHALHELIGLTPDTFSATQSAEDRSDCGLGVHVVIAPTAASFAPF